MAIFDLFSKRQKRLRGELPDIYSYDNIPKHLRVQLVHIIKDAIGKVNYKELDKVSEVYSFIHNVLCREYGLFSLGKGYNKSDECIYVFSQRGKKK